jgi:hypothetical protein
MFVDEQKSLKGSAHVAIASCDDSFDSHICPFGTHT